MINKLYDDKMAAWLEQNREKILQMWMELIRIPSVHSAAEPKAPFGPNCARALKASCEYLQSLDIPVTHNEDDGYAFADYGDGSHTIGLFAHSDVVPVGDGWLYTTPFEPVIRDGLMIGRGSSDNKNGIIASWCILAMLQACGIPVKNRIRVVVGSNEESGMKDIEAYVRNETMPDLCLVPDTGFPCALGEKGILRLWAKCNRPLTAVRSMKGGDAFNVVLDRVDTVLEPNEALAQELQQRCAQDNRVALTIAPDGAICLHATGIAKHAAAPAGSLCATWLTAQLLASCKALPAEDRQILSAVAQYLHDSHGEALGVVHVDSRFGSLTCANGMVDLEDGHLKVSLDIRYGTQQAPDELEQKLHRAWNNVDFQIVYMDNRPGYTTAPDSPVPAALTAVAEELSGHSLTCSLMQGGTYGRYLKNAFPVGTSIRHADREKSALIMPEGHGGAHQMDEAVDIESFLLGIRILAHYVLTCDDLLG